MMNHTALSLLAAACLILAAGLSPRSGHAWQPPAEEAPAHAEGGGAHHEMAPVNWYRLGEETPPLIASFVNLAIMIFILWYFARKPASRYFRERSQRIRSALDESETMKNEAEARFKQISGKLDRIEQEMQALKKEMIASAVEENERVISEARGRAEVIRTSTLRLIGLEKEAMLENLKREIAELVISRAREIIKVKLLKTDHDRMTKETVDYYAQNKIEGGQSPPSTQP